MTYSERPVVCIVDDDPDIRESLRFLFEEEDYEVEEVPDGAAALALVRADSHPRVMLLDRTMPRFDGLRTLRQLAEEPEVLRRTVILFMTARSDPHEPQIAELMRRHAIVTIAKPFDLDMLLASVERASKRLAEHNIAG